MHARAIGRSVALAATALLLAVPVTFADTVPADGDNVTAGTQDFFEIGPVGTGGSVTLQVWFDLICNTASHVDAGQTVVIAFGTPDVPDGGAATGTGTSIGPVPAAWPDDGATCPAGTAALRSATPSTVTLTTPTDPGVYDYTINYTRTLSPGGADDAGATRAPSRIFYELTVEPDAAPALVMPTALTVEGTTTGGAMVDYDVSATDAEDDPAPEPTCSPASGTFFALGSTEVDCTVTDSGGRTTTGGFTVAVTDTTAPTLQGMPASSTVAAADPSGTTLAYTMPTATDLVDPAPSVSCLPASGTAVPVGQTSVTCTAEDARHNSASASFTVDVTYTAPNDPPPPPALSAVFDAPIGPTNVLVANAGRNVPVKVRIDRDGSPVRSGAVDLVLAPCDGGAQIGQPRTLEYHGDRWTTGLDTTGLNGCIRATVRVDGTAAGSFELRFGGATGSATTKKDPPKSGPKSGPTTTTAPSAPTAPKVKPRVGKCLGTIRPDPHHHTGHGKDHRGGH